MSSPSGGSARVKPFRRTTSGPIILINVVLVEPEIPPNTGNIIRLCANTGAALHLVKPMGFEIDHKRMRRAGLDYREFVDMAVHENWPQFKEHAGSDAKMMAVTTKGSGV